MLRRHLAAIDYAGAALVWRSDAIVVHAVETLEPSRAEGWLRQWAGDSRAYRPELRRVPPTALALASAQVNFLALRDAVYQAVPDADHPRLRNLEALLSGLLLGQELSSRILPALGPAVIAYLDAPADSAADKSEGPGSPAGRGGLFPLVVVVDLAGGDPGSREAVPRRRGPSGVVVSDAAENALRTLLTVMALDEKRGRGKASIVTSEAAGASVFTLNVPIPFAFAIDRTADRLVLGTSAASVAHYLEAASDPEAGNRFREWQAAAFATYETFVCVDLDALTRLAGRYRAHLAQRLAARQGRPAAEVDADLEQALALARLFRAAFIASRIEPDASSIQRAFGLILKAPTGSSSSLR
jgi:hypothetical protein